MPDHVHMIFTPLVNQRAMEVYSLAEITDAIKGASAHKVNQAMERHGQVWQPESFDHVLRSSESLLHKVQYVLENPLRQGLAAGGKVIPGSGRSRSSTLMLYRLRVLTQAGH